MSFIKDKNDNYSLDTNGNKIEFNLEYIHSDLIHKHKEPLHINDNNNIDTEDRYIIIKEAIDDNHAVCKKQLDEVNNSKYSKEDIDNKLLALENKITASINSLKSQINELRILIGYNKMNNHMPSNFNSNR